jgi:hypothetical protein
MAVTVVGLMLVADSNHVRMRAGER